MADPRHSRPPCVIVLGMHRSGTSLLTGSLEAAGLYLGEVNHAARYNRKGNKENEAIRDLNDALLHRSGAAWNRPPAGQVRWSRADEERGKSLIGPCQVADRPWGFKDPRTVWTVEGWLRLLPHARLVGVFRHPSLVVQSLTARSGDLAIDADDALALWCAYNAELLRLQGTYEFPILHFGSEEAFQDDFVVPLTTFARSIGLTGPVERFFDGALLHQRMPAPVPSVEAWTIYERLVGVSARAGGRVAPEPAASGIRPGMCPGT